MIACCRRGSIHFSGDASIIGKLCQRTLAIFAECTAGAAGCSWPSIQSWVMVRRFSAARQTGAKEANASVFSLNKL
jgi:hypothetical protein